MERVTGIGGFFFRAKDPEALAAWYQARLGISSVPKSYEEEPWRQQEGATAFAPFELDSEMIGPPEHTWMLNFRVADLDAMVEQLRAARRGCRRRPGALSQRAVRLPARPGGKRHPTVATDGTRKKRLMGFEPTTFCMASRRSSQLSYSRTGAGG